MAAERHDHREIACSLFFSSLIFVQHMSQVALSVFRYRLEATVLSKTVYIGFYVVNYATVCLCLQFDGRRLIDIFVTLPSKKDYPNYYKVISEPIDMTTIEGKIKSEKVHLPSSIFLHCIL